MGSGMLPRNHTPTIRLLRRFCMDMDSLIQVSIWLVWVSTLDQAKRKEA